MVEKTYDYNDEWTLFKIKLLQQVDYFQSYVIQEAASFKEDKDKFENAFFKRIAFQMQL